MIKIVGRELKMDNLLLPASIQVYAVDGRLVWTASSNTQTMNLPALPNNQLMILQVTGSNGNSQTLKLVNSNN